MMVSVGAKTIVTIPVAWGEMDAYGHVNNTFFLRWFETVRIAWFDEVRFPEEAGKNGPVVRVATVNYLVAVKFPDSITMTAWPTKIGRTSVTLAYEARSEARRAVVATGETVVVFVDHIAGGSVELPSDFRARIATILTESDE